MLHSKNCTDLYCSSSKLYGLIESWKLVTRQSILMLFMLMLCTWSVTAQDTQIKQIEIDNYDVMTVNQKIAPDAQRLIGNVKFIHDDMIMTCDSAYYYSERNTLDAFSRVHITRTDGSLNIDGDFAKYQGNIKFAEIWNNVVLVDKDATMKTQHLYYDMNTNIAYYVVGAEIFNKGNDMVSQIGHYHRNINMFYFKTDVVLNTPDYTIVTDTLNYNVHTKLSDFVGPTYVQNEKDTIYCERGWYNTNDTVALFRQDAWMKSGSAIIYADTLFYESVTGNGRAFSNIQMVDTVNNIILKGHKGEYNNLTEKAWLTKQALMIMISENDSLFLHADTLRSDLDTLGFKVMKAYYKTKFYSLDMQGKCDSLTFSFNDSIIRMYHEPILWTGENQMTAEFIEILTEHKKAKQMNMLNNGFIISQEDSTLFNQIKGKKIIGLFRNGNDLYQVKVFGSGETVYYIRDGLDLTGANKTMGPDIVIAIKDKKAEQITHLQETDCEMIPVNMFDPEELTLNGFRWLIEYKPLDKDDIFKHSVEDQSHRSGAENINGIIKDSLALETRDSLRLKIEYLIQGKQANVGVAIMGFKDMDTLTINKNVHYPMQSVYKYHQALAILRQVDFGRMKLDQKVLVKKEDLRPDTYSPLRDEFPDGNMEMTIAELLHYSVSKSDNNACDILFKVFGGTKKVEQYLKSMKLSNIAIVFTEEEMHQDWRNQYQNWTTPYAAIKALEILFRQDMLSDRSREFLWKLLNETTTGPDKIKGNLPSIADVGHKTGNSFRNDEGLKAADNDIGIVRLPNGHHFMIAVFVSDSMEDDQTNAAIIADITRLVWDYYAVRKK